jgi:hypothetical protein
MQATPWLSDDITLTEELDDKPHDAGCTTRSAGGYQSTPQHQAQVPLATLTQNRGLTEQYRDPTVCKAVLRRPIQVTKWIYS